MTVTADTGKPGLGRRAQILISHWAVGLALAAPLAWLVTGLFLNTLGPNPIETLTRGLGEWGLRYLLLGLAITPLANLLRRPGWVRYRRTIGLFAFGAIFLHLMSWIGLDHFFAWGSLWQEIVKRPFITIGMAGFVALIPLALTSTNGMIRRLGPKRWKTLHRLTYVVAIAGVVHFFLLVKADKTEPLIYAGATLALLAWRAQRWLADRHPA